MASLQQESRAEGAIAYELSGAVLPRLDDRLWSNAAAHQQSAAASFSNATQHMDVTRWLTPGAQRSVGFSMGLASSAPSANLGAGGPAGPVRMDLGVRWRSRLDSGRHLHVAAWAETPPDTMGLIWQRQDLAYGTRVEMQWKSSSTRGLVPEFGAIGVQLQSNSRLVLRARKGGPMLYYRAKF